MTNPPPPPRPPSSSPPPPPRPALANGAGQPSGWYQDPWEQAAWRWWDGSRWTANVHAGAVDEKPKLPAWLSPLVVAASVPSLGVAVFSAWSVPLALLLGFAPLLLVAPVLIWMDRVEPEPWASRIHALLWGGFVAGLMGLVTNTIVALTTSENIAAVVSAPFSEEIGKALGIYWAVRRKEVDGIMDGLVYAGWVALGFAIIEDFGYFAYAGEDGTLFQVFIGRALLTPFAHPLFTAWTGLAIGRAVAQRKSLLTAWWGLALAIGTHALWNGSLVAAGPTDANPDGNPLMIVFVMLVFVGLFVAAVVAITRLRGRDEIRFSELIPFLAQRYALPPNELESMRNRRAIQSTRRALDRSERKQFDRVHSAVARLAFLHDQVGETDPAAEARLVTELYDARQGAGS